MIDLNVANHARIAATGARVFYGDLASTETLRHAGVEHSEVIVSTIPDDVLRGTSNRQLAQTLRGLAPRAMLVLNAVQIAEVEPIRKAGADYVYLWRVETARGGLPAVYDGLNGELARFIASRARDEGDLSRCGSAVLSPGSVVRLPMRPHVATMRREGCWDPRAEGQAQSLHR